MIRREDVADLREGDVVELSDDRWPLGTVLRGPVWLDSATGYLRCGPSYVRRPSGDHLPPMTEDQRVHRSITVVSRAPRPLYVNHDRTEPVPGDVARDEDADGIRLILRMSAVGRRDEEWFDQDGPERTYAHCPGRRLRLLVDGETGQVVP